MLIVAALALASPVYLQCDFSTAQAKWSVPIAIDEPNQRVTIGHAKGGASVVPALFSPDKVVATEQIGNETQTWAFDRLDLSVRTTTSFTTDATVGACKITPTPAKRAF